MSETEVRGMHHEHLAGLAAAEGLDYHLDEGVIGNTFDAHRVLHLARARDLQKPMVERFFRA